MDLPDGTGVCIDDHLLFWPAVDACMTPPPGVLDRARRVDQTATGLSETVPKEVNLVSEIGAFEAKTRLPQLLQRVEAGERFVITRHSRPVAELVPFSPRDPGKVRSAIDALTEFQRTHSLDGLSVREIVEEARKY